MHAPFFLTAATVVLLSSSLLLGGCQQAPPANGGTQPGQARVPAGATTARLAAERFFAAYKAHDRKAAEVVAADAAINALVWDPKSGDNPTLKLIDDTHIYYEGGSIELKMARNAAGRWYVQSVTSRAD